MSSGLSEPAANLYMQVARRLPSTWPVSRGQESTATMDNVDIVGLVNVNVVDVSVGVLVHVGIVCPGDTDLAREGYEQASFVASPLKL